MLSEYEKQEIVFDMLEVLGKSIDNHMPYEPLIKDYKLIKHITQEYKDKGFRMKYGSIDLCLRAIEGAFYDTYRVRLQDE